jgi:hypothetical protein
MASGRPGLSVWLRRVGWLVLIWLASVAALGVAAWASAAEAAPLPAGFRSRIAGNRPDFFPSLAARSPRAALSYLACLQCLQESE